MGKTKNIKRKKDGASPTKIILNHLKETSKDLFDLSIKIFFDQDRLIKEAGFYVKYPSISSILCKWASNLKSSTSFERRDGKIYLTDKGRIKIIKSIVREKNDEKKWDGKWRAVIFDIPELNRRERRFLRTELKQMKFKELQKSIWVCPCNIEKELFALLKLWKIDFSGDIRFLKIDKITEDKDIIEHFNL